jgi:hypothetical protein
VSGGVDLVVLPCSAKGTVSRAAQKRVSDYQIPLPTPKALGEIEVIPFTGPGSLSKEVAWAASVLDDKSTPQTISNVGRRLAEYANSNLKVRLLESPLLGGGAGGLDPVEAGMALRQGFLAACEVEATLVVYAYQTATIKSLNDTGSQ